MPASGTPESPVIARESTVRRCLKDAAERAARSRSAQRSGEVSQPLEALFQRASSRGEREPEVPRRPERLAGHRSDEKVLQEALRDVVGRGEGLSLPALADPSAHVREGIE